MSSPELLLSCFLCNLPLLKLIRSQLMIPFSYASILQGQLTKPIPKNAPSSSRLGSVIEKTEQLYVVCKVPCTSSLYFVDNVTKIDEVLIFIAFIW